MSVSEARGRARGRTKFGISEVLEPDVRGGGRGCGGGGGGVGAEGAKMRSRPQLGECCSQSTV